MAMETLVYGSLRNEGLEVVQRDGRYFVRYDAGAHQTAWREDELTENEFFELRQSGKAEYKVLVELQRRLLAAGEDPYKQNWTPFKVGQISGRLDNA